MRVDKWLWAARFFKTRTLAARACELGRVQANGADAKPSRELHVGDLLNVRTPSGNFEIEVLMLNDRRGTAADAQKLYSETDSSREARLKQAEERKAAATFDTFREGRPSKRDRRLIERLRGSILR